MWSTPEASSMLELGDRCAVNTQTLMIQGQSKKEFFTLTLQITT